MTKPKPGRPFKPKGTTAQHFHLVVPAEQAKWLRSQPGGISKTIQRLIQEQIK